MRALLLALLVTSCAAPPPDAYVNGTAQASGVSLGPDTKGEACTQIADAEGAAIFCGEWKQPSGHVRRGGPASGAELGALATSSPWRAGLETTVNCDAPVSTAVGPGMPAVLLSCTRRQGG